MGVEVLAKVLTVVALPLGEGCLEVRVGSDARPVLFGGGAEDAIRLSARGNSKLYTILILTGRS